MIRDEDTITAISTAMGEGGIGIVRLSGEQSLEIAEKIFIPIKKKSLKDLKPRYLYLGNVIDPESRAHIDEVLLVYYKAPYTYTREDMVEINCHGGLTAQKKILELTLKYGARLAEPGEFTKRAFLNGRIDLSQAEAVIDIIRAKTDKALILANRQLAGGLSDKIKKIREDLLSIIAHVEAGIDFPEEDIAEADPISIRIEVNKIRLEIEKLLNNALTGKILREGLSTLILGRTNVGKSSLLNALLKEERAIVTDVPGTTRDVIEEYININGVPIKIIDTAGIRETSDIVEKIGVDRAKKYLQEAEMVLLVLDASVDITDDDIKIIDMLKDKFTIVVLNKTDLNVKVAESRIKELLPGKAIVKVSALREEGIEQLKNSIYEAVTKEMGPVDENTIITGERQRLALSDAAMSLKRAEESLEYNLPLELVEIDIKESWQKLGEIIGDTINEKVIDAIFENFCIGK